MALGLFIAAGIAIIFALVIVKLIRSTGKTSYFGETKRCKTCGRKMDYLKCRFCEADSKSLR